MRLFTFLAFAASLGATALLSGCAGNIHAASWNGMTGSVRTYLDAGVPADSLNSSGASPLMLAAGGRNTEIVKLLLERGAPINQRAPGGNTALDMALMAPSNNEVISMLRAAGAKTGAELSAAPAGEPRKSPGNLDDAAYDRMRASAALPPEKKESSSDIDAPARRGAERPDDFALVIGIEEYQSVPKADFGARDAKTVRRHLEALGFPARNIISLEGSQATGSKLRSYLEEWLPLNVKPTSTLFVYYSGHGAPDAKTGDAYLVPWDGDPKFLKSTALPLKKFYADLAKTKAKRVIVALDACFSGAGGRSVLAQGARPLVAKMAELTPTEGRITILAAASGDEITGTLQEQSHGLFTYHLLKGLSADPKASAQSLFDYLKPRVQDDARRENRDQTPVLAGASLSAPLLP